MKNYIKAGGSSKIGNYIKAVASGPALDPDAAAFLTAASITDPTITSAINTLVLDMKGYGIWSKMKAIYPFVGGTASTHKWNLVNPVDSDAAFRLVFSGGMTHSSNGILFGGVNGYGDTFFNTDDVTSTGLQSFGVYLRTNPTFAISTNYEYPTGLRNGIYHLRILNTNPTQTNLRSGTVNSNINGVTGFIAQSRSTNTLWYGINNSTITILPISTSTLSIETIYTFNVGAYQNLSNPSFFSTQEFAFSFYGEPLLTTEMSDFYTSIQTFQTTLGRQV